MVKKQLKAGRGTQEAAAKARRMLAEAFWLGRKGIEMTGQMRELADTLKPIRDGQMNILWKYWHRGNRNALPIQIIKKSNTR